MHDDFHLLDRYLVSADQAAFRQLVEAHLPMVYSLARREFRGNPIHAEDIAQSVFILLVQKSRENKIPRRRPLAAWLYQTTRYCCSNLKRIEARRIRRESEIAMLTPAVTHAPEPDFDQVELLNSALAALSPTDRDLLLLRYSPAQPPIPQLAAALNISPAAAEKRLARALDKLRAHFSLKEQLAGAASLPALLALQSPTAPAHLSSLVTSVATSATTCSPLALALVASFAKSSLPLKAAAILLFTLTSLSVSALIGWNLLGTSPIAAATPAAATFPAADALPDLILGQLPQRTYFADLTKNIFPQGIFENAKEKQLPAGWSASPDPFATGNAAIDIKRPLISFTSSSFGQKIEMHSSVPLKPEWKKVAVRATLGIQHFHLGDSGQSIAGVMYIPVDKNNAQIGPGVLLDASTSTTPFIKILIATLDVPPGTASLAVTIRLSDATGTLYAARLGVVPVDEAKEPDPSQVVALQSAIKKGDVNTVVEMITADKRLLECRNMQWECGTPLLGATWANKDEVLSALINLGADLKAHEDNGDNVDGYWSASLSACYRGRDKCLQILLDASPENPEKLSQMIRFGMASHKTSGNPAAYQRCLDLVAAKFPGVVGTMPGLQPAP